MIIKIIILLVLLVVGIFSSINFMDSYSESAIQNFKSKRNETLIILLLIFLALIIY